ncbi:acetyltransferase [Chitinophaga oryziterrae]|uniref:Acetyltransferase n=1 Tax=Chitinophaga oryziterrae TaxID=1031224 RepID=A0A6N8JAA6_9BACT|nr:acetyltransferase [Chitinophaga oryziterrae]MVT42073.1 acetyltransferase [Chitinophaga oryziterrae]
MHRKSLILIGGGGHCKSCIDVIESTDEWIISGIIDKEEMEGKQILGYPVIGTDNDLDRLVKEGHYFLITIGQIKSADSRKILFSRLREKDAKIATVVSSKAIVSKYASIGPGTIVHHSCIVNAAVNIGANCIINTAANIEHDTQVGDHTHVSTCAVLNGNVMIGSECFIGSGTVISNGIHISDNVIIGAGSVLMKSINVAGIYAGTPGKIIVR